MRAPIPALMLLALAVGACSDEPQNTAEAPAQPGAPASGPQANNLNPPPLIVPPAEEIVVAASSFPMAQAIDAAVLGAQTPIIPTTPTPGQPAAAPQAKAQAQMGAVKPGGYDPALVRAQVLLDRARFSPGVIDGRDGGNMKLAVTGFQTMHNLPVTGVVDQATWAALVAGDAAPAMQDYVITPQDAAGPYDPQSLSDDYEVLATLTKLSYATPSEALAERFHMDEALLKTLNPGADFAVAGTKIVVARPGPDALPEKVARIEIDKAMGELRALNDAGAVIAVYPATIGSSDRPAPDGTWAVRTLAPAPTYTYDPTRLTFGRPSLLNGKKKLTIAAGPNNPVGSTWIDLTKDTFGIHGTPDPRLVGKRASHGCIRLTNWDARELGSAVRKGTVVVFEGREKAVKA